MKNRYVVGRAAGLTDPTWAVLDTTGTNAPILTKTREMARGIATNLNQEDTNAQSMATNPDAA